MGVRRETLWRLVGPVLRGAGLLALAAGLVVCAVGVAGAAASGSGSGAGAASPSPGAGASPEAAPDAASAAVLDAARSHLGDAYAWGGNGPHSWDCSGLVAGLWHSAGGVDGIPRTAAAQQAWAVAIPSVQLLPGDLVFFGDPVSHVALWLGNGQIIDASSSRSGVVQRGVWAASVIRYGRVPRAGMPPVSPWAAPSGSPSASESPSAPATASPAAPGAPSASPTGSPSAARPSAARPSASASASPPARARRSASPPKRATTTRRAAPAATPSGSPSPRTSAAPSRPPSSRPTPEWTPVGSGG